MRKHVIVNALIRKHNYRSYLEVCTPYAGGKFARIDRAHARTCERLVYRCPSHLSDRREVTYRTEGEDTAGLVPDDRRYEAIFIDAWHTLACVERDIRDAFARLVPGGAIVLHDCLPPTRGLAQPVALAGGWCGLTYCGFLDFVLATPGIVHYTVDSDFGCGVIRKVPRHEGVSARFPPTPALTEEWFDRRRLGEDMFDFFKRHERALLHLVSVSDFLALEGIERGPLPRFVDRLSTWPIRHARF